MDNKQLTPAEIYFCELYVHGDAPYAGNAGLSYKEAFNPANLKTSRMQALKLLAQPEIKAKIEELELMDEIGDFKSVKKFIGQNLKHIVEECATAEYMDRKGTKLSVAPLRAVAVNASKALMELYPVKEAQKHELNIGGAGEGGITFNVIMPDQTKDASESDAK